jgi:hypothetical protein
MKLDLAGSSYTNRAISAAGQQSLNLYRETVEVQGGSGKSEKIRGTPGRHLLANLNAHSGNVRAFGAVAGAAGSW